MMKKKAMSLILLVLVIAVDRISAYGSDRELSVLQGLHQSLGPNRLNWSGSDYCSWLNISCNEDGMVGSINLSGQNLTGTLPASIGSLKYLKTLDVSYNQISGPFPALYSLQLLEILRAQNNNFSSFPEELFSSQLTALSDIDISYNSFAPWNITGHCGELQYFHASNANIRGAIDVLTCINFPRLVRLNLSNNQLNGTIPLDIKELQFLRVLDLSNNKLSGRVPEFGKKIRVRLDGNLDLKWDTGHSHHAVLLIVIGCVGGLLIVVIGIVGLIFYLKKKQLPSGEQNVVELTANPSTQSSQAIDVHSSQALDVIALKQFSLENLMMATISFTEANLLGKGGFAKVFKGVWENTEIAVKRMNKIRSGVEASNALDMFKSEVELLSKLQHRNLVALIGYCWNEDEKILVYEYMPQGTLRRHLFEWKQENLSPLDWPTRLSIAFDIAKGVDYLHSATNQILVHRDLKPTNILLGANMRAKVADFGLVYSLPEGKDYIMTPMAGTQGYWPEECVDGKISDTSDVYTFGILLLELISGRKVNDSVFLPTWFLDTLNTRDEKGKIIEYVNKSYLGQVIDPVIDISNETLVAIANVAELALHFIHRKFDSRPSIARVLGVLTLLIDSWKPPQPEEVQPRLTVKEAFRRIDSAASTSKR
ncbi:receptor protein kinase TMK1-like isoform X2 [Rosa rugosa]|nr:receptor protein kinase TMK1-like isoform X2 [Rosa rugosa]